MNFEQIKELLFKEAISAGLSDYDVYFRMASDASAEALNKELSSSTFGVAGGVSFRCAVNGRIGSASTQCLEKEELTALVARAVANAAVIDADESLSFLKDRAIRHIDTWREQILTCRMQRSCAAR